VFVLLVVCNPRFIRNESLEIKKSDMTSRSSQTGSSSVGYISKASAPSRTLCGGMMVKD